MIQSEFAAALNQVAAERGISPESVVETLKAAMISAYRKEYGIDTPPHDPEAEEGEANENAIEVVIDPDDGETRLMQDGKDITPAGFGRIAAQTAKQVILQKINEAERAAVVEEYRGKVGSIVSGNIFRVERGLVVVEVGKAHAIMPPSEQIPGEHYHIGRRVRFLLLEIREGERGDEIVLSRAHADFVKELFALEVPEITAETVTVEAIAREAGLRTKIAVSASIDKVDPVGSCVGQKGVRVQAVMDELGEERIDIIPFDPDLKTFVSNALSPAEVKSVEIDEAQEHAVVDVEEDQLSLAIGKGGQNVRLAAKLVGLKIDVAGGDHTVSADAESGDALDMLGLSTRVANALREADITSPEQLTELSDDGLSALKGIGAKAVEAIRDALTSFESSAPQADEDTSEAETEDTADDTAEAETSDEPDA